MEESTQEQVEIFSEVLEVEKSKIVSMLLYIPHAFLRLFRYIGGKVKSFFQWIGRGLSRFAGFLKSPAENGRELIKEKSTSLRKSIQRLRREMDPLSWIQLIGIIVIFGLFLIAPLLGVVWGSFVTDTGFTLSKIIGLFTDPMFVPQWRPEDFDFIQSATGIVYIYGIEMGVILNSIYVALAVTAISVALGTSFAFLMARYDFTGKTILRTLLL